MANIFFLSDPHFTHAAMLKFTQANGEPCRVFDSVEAMDECMVQRWNEVVRSQDHVYILGDVVMRRKQLVILERLNGHLRLIRGNHDIFKTKDYLKWVDEIYGVRVLDNILFSHFPVHAKCMGRFKANVHGHTHHNCLPPPYLNVCVEVIDYRPVSFEQLRQTIVAWPPDVRLTISNGE